MNERRLMASLSSSAARVAPGLLVVVFAFLTAFLAGCSDSGDPLAPADTTNGGTTPSDSVDWVHNVGPLFQARCVACHGGAAPQSGFDASTYASVLNHTTAAGNPAIAPNDTTSSEVFLRVKGVNFPRMPQGGMLSSSEIDLIREWILDGAPEEVLVDTAGGGGGGGGNGGGGTVASDSITWTNTVGRVLQNNCVACHGPARHENDFFADSYASVMSRISEAGNRVVDTTNVEQSEILLRLEGNGFNLMPNGGPALAAEVIDSVRTWIQNGAPETEADIGTGGGTIPQAIDWISAVGPILSNHCTQCHGGPNPTQGLDLSSYTALMDHRTAANNDAIKEHDLQDSELYRRINGDGFSRMPPAPNAPLSAGEIDTIRQWILNDAPYQGSGDGKRSFDRPDQRLFAMLTGH